MLINPASSRIAGVVLLMSNYLEDWATKLRHAEAMAAQCAEGSWDMESWLMIANGYRELLGYAGFGIPKPH